MSWSATMNEPVTSVPEGEYDALLEAVDEQEAPYGPVNRYEFRLSGAEGIEGRKVTGLTSTYMAENTKKGRWVTAILGRVPSVGDRISEQDLLNKPCRVVVAHKTDAKGLIRANVVDVLPVLAPEANDLAF